jgi:phosphoribosyl-dephospho-CoA transferase
MNGKDVRESCPCMCLLRVMSDLLLDYVDSMKKPGQKRREHLHDFSTVYISYVISLKIYIRTSILPVQYFHGVKQEITEKIDQTCNKATCSQWLPMGNGTEAMVSTSILDDRRKQKQKNKRIDIR